MQLVQVHTRRLSYLLKIFIIDGIYVKCFFMKHTWYIVETLYVWNKDHFCDLIRLLGINKEDNNGKIYKIQI